MAGWAGTGKGTMIETMKTNYHTHCSYCDGIAEPETVVLAALEQGFDILGFSSHQPLSGEEWTMAAGEVSTYVKEVRGLAEKVQGEDPDPLRYGAGLYRLRTGLAGAEVE